MAADLRPLRSLPVMFTCIVFLPNLLLSEEPAEMLTFLFIPHLLVCKHTLSLKYFPMTDVQRSIRTTIQLLDQEERFLHAVATDEGVQKHQV